MTSLAEEPGDRELCIKSFLLSKGVRSPECLIVLRARAKLFYLQDHPSYAFENKDVFFEGRMVNANIWYESQRSYLEKALADMRAYGFLITN